MLLETMTTPAMATTMPTTWTGVSGVPSISQAPALTSTELKLIKAEMGPVGPSQSALARKSSAPAENKPAVKHMRTVSALKKYSIGRLITPTADRNVIKNAQRESIRR